MELPIYELKINDLEKDAAEVSFIALVDAPAIKRDFLAFKDHLKFETLEEERIIYGPLMIPEQLIYRASEKFGEHYVKFSTDTIKSIAIKFAKKGYQKNINLMHDEDMQVDGVTMFESFITNKKRGINPMEAFKDLPEGTWFGGFKVENEKVWEAVKAGAVKGFSVEGLFDYEKPASKEDMIKCPHCKADTRNVEAGMGHMKCDKCSKSFSSQDADFEGKLRQLAQILNSI